jgi:hypothetical protein
MTWAFGMKLDIMSTMIRNEIILADMMELTLPQR